jgi:hypothetical protein
MLQFLIFAAFSVLMLGALSLAPRRVQRLLAALGVMMAVWIIGLGVAEWAPGLLLGGLMLLALVIGLDFVLGEIKRDVNSPSGQAPGGAHAPGEVGKRDGERDAPILPGVRATAGRAGRPRSFSGASR